MCKVLREVIGNLNLIETREVYGILTQTQGKSKSVAYLSLEAESLDLPSQNTATQFTHHLKNTLFMYKYGIVRSFVRGPVSRDTCLSLTLRLRLRRSLHASLCA